MKAPTVLLERESQMPDRKPRMTFGLIRQRTRVALDSARIGLARRLSGRGGALLMSELRLRVFKATEEGQAFFRSMTAAGVPADEAGRTLRSLAATDPRLGRWYDYGVVSRKVITDAGVAFIVDDWDTSATDITNFNSHGYGTGTASEAVGDIALGAEQETPRGAGTKSQPAANQLRSVQTHTFAATFAITEHGIFSAATAGTLWDRSVFSAINVVSGDAIQATYTATLSSGG